MSSGKMWLGVDDHALFKRHVLATEKLADVVEMAVHILLEVNKETLEKKLSMKRLVKRLDDKYHP